MRAGDSGASPAWRCCTCPPTREKETPWPSTAQVLETIDPATGEVIAEVPDATAADVDAAVARAREAFRPGGAWRSLHPPRALELLWRIGDLIDEHADELAELETRDQGQPIGISRNVSVAAAAEHFRYYAGWVTKIAGETNPLSFPGDVQLHAARARRRLRPDHPVELPAHDRCVEARAGAGLREHVRRQARRADAADRAAPRGADRRGRHPRRRRQGRHRRPGGRRRARRASRRRQDLVHRLHRGRALGHPGVGRQLQARLARARRQESRRSSSTTRRSTAAVAGVLQGGLLNSGQVCASYSRVYVQRRVADAFAEAAAVGGVLDDASGLVSSRRRSSGRSSRTRIARASRDTSGGASTRAPSCSAAASAPATASRPVRSSHPRCSPASKTA